MVDSFVSVNSHLLSQEATSPTLCICCYTARELFGWPETPDEVSMFCEVKKCYFKKVKEKGMIVFLTKKVKEVLDLFVCNTVILCVVWC